MSHGTALKGSKEDKARPTDGQTDDDVAAETTKALFL